MLFQVEVYSWVILLAATFAQLSISYISQGIGTLAPFLTESFSLNNTLIGLSGVAVNAGMLLMSAIAGTLVDILGEKVVLVTGGILAGLGIMLTSRADSFNTFLALLFFTGIWASVATPAGSKAVMTWFPYSKRGLVLGIRQTGIPLGGLAAALTLPIIAMYINWRGAMLVMGSVSLLGAFVAFWAMKKPPDQPTKNVAPLPLVEVGVSRLEQNSRRGMIRQVLKNRPVWLLSVTAATFASAQFTLVAHLLVYVHKALGHPIILASIMLALAQLTGAMARIILGVFSDTLFQGRRKPLLAVCGIQMMVMAIIMSQVTSATPIVLVAIIIFLFGFAAIGWNGLFVAFISEIVGMDQAGTAVGLGLTLTQIGVLGFPPIFGFVVDTSGSYGPGWLLLAFLILLGLVVLTRVKEKSLGR